MSEISYRPDIDGLRGIAVLSVVSFHAFPTYFQGGFVGVDIFFVISGFLISSIIAGALERSKFSFIEFYVRRIKRIFPALLLVLIACFTFGWFVLFAHEYKQLGKHIAGGAGFVSNLLLWNESGYFDNAAETKPLLHLWSLGVEEQFYIIWPLLLWLAWKRQFNLLTIAFAVGVVSFWLNVDAVGSDQTAAFYSPQTRFWELMAGSVLAYLTLHKQIIFADLKNWLVDKDLAAIVNFKCWQTLIKLLSNLQSVLGAVLIAVSIAVISKEKAFPGWWAMLPVLGSILIISASPQSILNREVLSSRMLVWVGLISYPLYLWHWPILSFARIVAGKIPSGETRIGAVLISIVLAWLTYILLEKPIRFGSYGRIKALMLVVLMAVTGIVGYGCYESDGFQFRQNKSNVSDLVYNTKYFRSFSCPDSLRGNDDMVEFCAISSNKQPTYAIIGDSLANDKYFGMAGVDKSHSWLLAGKVGGCPPIYGIEVKENCLKRSEQVIDWVANNTEIKTVIFSFAGRGYLDTNFDAIQKENKWRARTNVKARQSKLSVDSYSDGLELAISMLEESGKSVVILLPPPLFDYLPLDCLRNPLLDCEPSRSSVVNKQLKFRTILNSISRVHKNIRIYDPLDIFCNETKCFNSNNEMFYFYDDQHLSVRGSIYYATHFLKWLNSLPLQ
jgi:peptidoglycan/LPS O-acetylase OafA/YrhL